MPIKTFALGRLEGGTVHLLGTCFLVKANTFATAAHTFDANDTNIVVVIPEDLNDFNAYQQQTRVGLQLVPLKLKDVDPVHDLAIFELAAGATMNSPHIPKLSSTDTTAVGDKVYTLGYPHSRWGMAIMVLQEATVGARVLVTKGTLQIRHVIINQQSVVGQSGAPVFAAKDGSVVGILVGAFAPSGGGGISMGGIDPQTLHQTSYAVSAEYLSGMLK
jgi:V8-like Glu-specific endopeptidase